MRNGTEDRAFEADDISGVSRSGGDSRFGDRVPHRTGDCSCPRCSSMRYEMERRTSLDAFLWSLGLFRRYPGTLAIFALVIFLEVLFSVFSSSPRASSFSQPR